MVNFHSSQHRPVIVGSRFVGIVLSDSRATYPQRLQRPWVLVWLSSKVSTGECWRGGRVECVPLAKAGSSLGCVAVSKSVPLRSKVVVGYAEVWCRAPTVSSVVVQSSSMSGMGDRVSGVRHDWGEIGHVLILAVALLN